MRNPTYSNALTNITEKALTYYKKALKTVSKSEEVYHSQEKGRALPADQPTMEPFWQMPRTDSTTSTQT